MFLKAFASNYGSKKQLSVEIWFTTKRFKKCTNDQYLQKEFMSLLIKYLDLLKACDKEYKNLDIINIMTLIQSNNHEYFK